MCLNAKRKPNSLIGDHKNLLNISFWNIHGKQSKHIGDKFLDDEFLKALCDSHIIGLVELHTESVPNIPGFKLIKQKIRKKTHKGPKIAGGLAVFAKTEFANLVKPVENDNEDSIWVKLKKEETGERGDIFIGTIYLSPSKQANGKDDGNTSLEAFFREIGGFKEKGIVFTQGDFNAHTNNLPDYLVTDKTDEIFGIENGEKPLSRNSEDRKPTNERGLCLLELCKAYDFLIVNGRKTGDIFGKYTSFQWNGSRTVDYVISAIEDHDRILDFKVGAFCPWFSDHCPLHYNISIKRNLDSKRKDPIENLKDSPRRFIWNSLSKTKFESYMKSEFSKDIFNNIMTNVENKNPAVFVNDLTVSILRCVTESGIKITSKKKIPAKKNAPWFDSVCLKLKRDLEKLAYNLKHSPNNNDIREKMFCTKRELKYLVRTKKNAYKRSIIEKMHTNCKSDPKTFWKLLDKISLKPSRESTNRNNINVRMGGPFYVSFVI